MVIEKYMNMQIQHQLKKEEKGPIPHAHPK